MQQLIPRCTSQAIAKKTKILTEADELVHAAKERQQHVAATLSADKAVLVAKIETSKMTRDELVSLWSVSVA